MLGWGAGAHWIRHLLPALPIYLLACGGGLSWVLERVGAARFLVIAGTWAVGLSGLSANLGPVASRTADRVPVAMGCHTQSTTMAAPSCTENAEALYLREHLRGYAGIEWANEHLPEDAKVALLFQADAFLIERETILGSVEDHTPSRHFLFEHGDQSLEVLRALGVSHVMISKTKFLRKEYPFLSDEQFERDFQSPTELLAHLLMMEATKVYESKPTTVYRLDGP